MATEQRVDGSECEDLKNPTFNFEQNTLSHAQLKMRQSQELHKLKLQQGKNQMIRGRILDAIGQTEGTRGRLERQQLAGPTNIEEEGNVPEEARLNDTLTRCVKQLSVLNANLQTKLQERF